MEQPGVQQLFFQHIKNNLPPHISLVDEITGSLQVFLLDEDTVAIPFVR
jgi:hypothetical protein